MSLPAQAPPLRVGAKVGYGVGYLATGVVLTGLSATVLTFYLNQVVGVPALLSGTLIALSLMFDAVIDPLIGQWSDNLRSRWGRRHPFMYVAAVLWALSFYILWHAPKELSGSYLLVFILVLLVAVRVSGSLYDITSNALVPELAPGYDERTGLLSFRWFFLIIGLAGMSVLLNAYFLAHDASHQGLLARNGYARFGAFGAVVVFLAAMVSALSTHHRIKYLHAPPVRRVTLVETVKEMAATMTNPTLLILLLCGLLGGAAGGLRTALDNYFYLHFWGLTPTQIGILAPLGVLGSVVAVLIAPVLSRRLGKKMTMITFFTFSTIISLAPMGLKLMGLMPPNSSGWVLVILCLDALVVAILGVSGFVIISSMVADVVEDQAVKTGVRSEGLLFATNGLVPKFTTAIGVFFAGVLINAVHFPDHAKPGTVPPELMRELVLSFLPVYVVLVSLSIGVLLFYRIDRSAHEANMARMRDAAALAATSHVVEAEQGGGSFTPPLHSPGEA